MTKQIHRSDRYETKDGGIDNKEIQEIVDSVKSEVKTTYDALDRKTEALAKTMEEMKTKGADTSALENRIAELGAQIKENAKTADAMDKKLAEVSVFANKSAAQHKTAGFMFGESDEFKALQKARMGSATIQAKSITNILATTARGPLTSVQTLDTIIANPDRPLMVRDLIPVGRTTSSTIEFPRENVFTNNAAPVAEEAQKSESDITFTAAKSDVITIAHWIRASKQVLDDVPMLQSYIDGRLRVGLAQKEEDQLMLGSGTASNMLGLIPQATAYAAIPGVGPATANLVDQIRIAKLQVRKSFYAADAIVLNPEDWAHIELLKDTQGGYLYSAFASGGVPRLWGMRVVESDSIAPDRFMVGSFGLAAQIWDREDATVTVSTEDRDNFVKNMVTILAEERLGLTVYRPKAFVYGDFGRIA